MIFFTKKYKKKIRNTKKYKGGNFKKMSCNPSVKGKTINKNSCLTQRVLLKIKEEYNKDHTDNPITKTKLNDIWHELKIRLSNCKKEDCWLNEIDNTMLRTKIDKMIFAPDHPPDWNKNPDEWLSNFDILEVLKQYETPYSKFQIISPTPIDFDSKPYNNGECVTNELCNFSVKEQLTNNKTKIGIVFNLDKHTESGSHWVSLFLDLDEKFIVFFDSVGNHPVKEIANLIHRIIKQAKENNIKVHYFNNTNPIPHQRGNTECGMYSLYFITTMLTGESGNGFLKTTQDRINHFQKENRIPDEYVFNYRKKFFNNGGDE